MISNEEYLESLLQSMMNGEVASPAKGEAPTSVNQKSAIEMLGGEKVETVISEGDAVSENEIADVIETVADITTETDAEPVADLTTETDAEPVIDITTETEAEPVADLTIEIDTETMAENIIPEDMEDVQGEIADINDVYIESEVAETAEENPMTSPVPETDDLIGREIETPDMDVLELEEMTSEVTEEDNMNESGLREIAIDEAVFSEIVDTGKMEESEIENIKTENAGFAEFGLGDLALEETDAETNIGDGEINLEDMLMTGSDLNEMLLGDMPLDDMALEESGMDELSLDDMIADAMPDMAELENENMPLDDMALEESGMDELSLDDMTTDAMPGMDELSLDDMVLEEHGLDEMSLDDMALEEHGLDDMSLDEMALEEHDLGDMSWDDMTIEEPGMDELSLDDMTTDAMPGMDELSLDDMTMDSMPEMDDISLNDMVLEEHGLDDMSFDGLTDDFALAENVVDDDLAEINDLFGQSGQDDDIDAEMLALLESVSDSDGDEIDEEDGGDDLGFLQGDEPEELGQVEEVIEIQKDSPGKKKEKKSRKEKRKKAANGEADLQEELAGLVGTETSEKEDSNKKPGVFARILAFLTESDEDEETDVSNGDNLPTGEPSEENKELLNELDVEDKKNKKSKKEKKKKKGKKDKNKKAGAEGEGEGEESEEDEKDVKKKKKAKKEKKKKDTEDTAPEIPEKKLSKKKIIPVIVFCTTIAASIIIFSMVIPAFMQKRDARVAYDMGNYEEAYDLLYGKNLNEEDESILNKSTLILMMERKLASYQNYQKMDGDELLALDVLMQGTTLYYELLPKAEQYNVVGEIRGVYQEILAILSAQYNLSETEVMEIIESEDDVVYTERLAAIVYGISFADGIGVEVQDEGGRKDVLPEEQEIIDRLPEEATDISLEDAESVVDDNGVEDLENGAENIPADTAPDAEGTMNGTASGGEVEPLSVEIHQN